MESHKHMPHHCWKPFCTEASNLHTRKAGLHLLLLPPKQSLENQFFLFPCPTKKDSKVLKLKQVSGAHQIKLNGMV